MAPLNKLEGVFALFSCIVFELNYAKTDLVTCAAVHGAGEGWDYMRKNPGQVYVDIERRGPSLVGGEPDWHVDVITRAYGAGRYHCWFSARYASLEHALLAAQWLSQHDWKVLRDAPSALNGARRLDAEARAQLESIAPFAPIAPLGSAVQS